MTLRLLLLGTPAVEIRGERLDLPFERRTQLLVYLALRRTPVSRADLASLLWPRQPAAQAFTNLRKTLFRMQSTPWADAVKAVGGLLQVEASSDVLDFEQALRAEAPAALLAVRDGELLRGFEDDDNELWSNWLLVERERLRVMWRQAALARLAADGERADAMALSARLLEIDPLDEAALGAHMTWLARDGQAARARQAYRAFADRLAQELGVAPGSELRALNDALGAVASPAPAAVAVHAPEEGFVGRSVELRQIRELLSNPECRLLTLVGPGGVGKTRLARQAMHALASVVANDAEFISLEDVPVVGEIAGRLAQDLGVRLDPRRDPLDSVIDFLQARRMLLVLDNLEHLAAGAPLLLRLVQGCPGLKLLVTSRVRLGLPLEWLMPVSGLPCPEASDLDHIEAFDAVRLFVQAARRVEPTLLPTSEAAAIIDICRQVEGLPLALELAASWTRVLSCESIAAELRQGSELLRATDAAHPVRHASIAVVFEQTWRLLGPTERDALSRLAVFSGGFTPQAARAVADASLPVLATLADQSLLRKDGARLFMHPLVQQLAAQRLGTESGASTRQAHAMYYLRWLAELRHGVEAGDREAMQWVDTECDNCRSALQWSVTHDARDVAAKGVTTLLQFCDHRARLEEGLTILQETIASHPDGETSALKAMLMGAAAHLEYRLDRYDEAESTAVQALNNDEVTHHPDTQLQCLKVLGSCSLRRGRLDDAERFFRQALARAPASMDPRNAAAMLDNLSLVEKGMGNYAEARRLSMQSLAQYRRLGDVAGEALCLNNLAVLLLEQDEDRAAGAYLREGLALCDGHGLVSTRGLILANLVEVEMKTGDPAAAQAHAERALELAQAAGQRSVISWLRLQCAQLALQRGDLARARGELADAATLALALQRPALQLTVVAGLAEVLLAQGDADGARMLLAFATEHPAVPARERQRWRERLAQLPGVQAQRPWPGIELDELLDRMVLEARHAHAPLLSSLRAA
jgi:predicted ATPase/DNA-binding SARP family transcriptional activator/Tfp pilus assembly protein PilF